MRRNRCPDRIVVVLIVHHVVVVPVVEAVCDKWERFRKTKMLISWINVVFPPTSIIMFNIFILKAINHGEDNNALTLVNSILNGCLQWQSMNMFCLISEIQRNEKTKEDKTHKITIYRIQNVDVFFSWRYRWRQ